MFCDFAQTNCGIRPDSGLFIHLKFSKVLQQVIVNDSIAQLIECRFSTLQLRNVRHSMLFIQFTSGTRSNIPLMVSSRIIGTPSVKPKACKRNRHYYSQPLKLHSQNTTYNVWKDLVIDDLFGQTFNITWKLFQKSHSYSSIGCWEHADDARDNNLIVLLIREITANFDDATEHLWSTYSYRLMIA